jgi:hypothetical protein
METNLDYIYQSYHQYKGFTLSNVLIQPNTAIELTKDGCTRTIEFSPLEHTIDNDLFIRLWRKLVGYTIDSVFIFEQQNLGTTIYKEVNVVFKTNADTKVARFNEDSF